MSFITALAVNAMLAASVLAAILWLLGHYGIHRGIRHDLRLIRRRAAVTASRVARDVERDLAA